MHEITIFDWYEFLYDKFDLFWKIIGFWDACSGIFTEILNPVAENGDPKGRHVPDRSDIGGGGGGGGLKVSEVVLIQ